MRFERRFLTMVFCVCASIAMAQPSGDGPAPLYRDPDLAAPTHSESAEPPVAEPGAEAVPPIVPGDAPEAGAPAAGDELAAEGSTTAPAAEPEDWVTQPDTSPFDLGMPFDQQPDGAFRYAYPLDLPGLRGLAPGINLNYATLGRPVNLDNFLGDGWRVGGLSQIVRTSISGGVPAYDNAVDILQLDGGELLACADTEATNPYFGSYPFGYTTQTSSASCKSGGNLVATHDNFLKIVQSGSRGARDAVFYIYRKDGTRLKYESLAAVGDKHLSDDSIWRDVVYNRVWLLSEIRDAQSNPNIVTISYEVRGEDYGFSYRPSEINYAGYKAVFSYEEYAGSQTRQLVSTFGTGLYAKQALRLTGVVVQRDAAVIRRYDVIYRYVDPRDLVARLEQKSASGALLSEVSFSYDETQNPGPDANGVGQFYLLNTITNARGGTTSVTYGANTDASFVTNDNIRGARKLVQKIEAGDGRGNPTQVASFKYADSVYSTVRSRSVGFRKVTATLPKIKYESENPRIVSEYHNASYAENGVLDKRSYYIGSVDEGAVPVRRIDYGYDTAWTGRGPWRAQLASVKHETWEEGLYLQSMTFSEMNEFGEPFRIRRLGYTSDNGMVDLDPDDDLVTAYSYEALDRANYIVANPTMIR